jgi:2-polyprenyl-3-methyl-5-hydroxy-6-metoxy-1,4-benzoquinol methylase
MKKINYKHLRKTIFREKYETDKELTLICQNAPSHDFLTNPSSQVIYQYLIKFVAAYCENYFQKKRADLRILDWGCGKGHCSYLIQKAGIPINACDIISDKDDSAFHQQTPIINTLNIEVTPLENPIELPYLNESFDAVISMGVLEHVQNDLASLQEIHRILRKDGLMFCFFLPQTLSWTQYISRKGGNTYHDRLYNKKIIHELCAASKFKITDYWHRQFLPKNSIHYPFHNTFEKLDHWINEKTFLKFFSTNIEFVAKKDH